MMSKDESTFPLPPPPSTNQDTHRSHTRQNQPTTTAAKTEIVHTQQENVEKTTSNRLAVSPGFHYFPPSQVPSGFLPTTVPFFLPNKHAEDVQSTNKRGEKKTRVQPDMGTQKRELQRGNERAKVRENNPTAKKQQPKTKSRIDYMY